MLCFCDKQCLISVYIYFISVMHPSLFTLRIHHGGTFRDGHHLDYIGGNIHNVRDVNTDKIFIIEINDMAESLGCVCVNKIAYKHHSYIGLSVLKSDSDIINMISLVPTFRTINVYIGHDGYGEVPNGEVNDTIGTFNDNNPLTFT